MRPTLLLVAIFLLLPTLSFAQPPVDMVWLANGTYFDPTPISGSFSPTFPSATTDGNEYAAAFSTANLLQVGPPVQAAADGRVIGVNIYRDVDCNSGFYQFFPDCPTNKATNVIECSGGDCGTFFIVLFDPDAAPNPYFLLTDLAGDPLEFDFDDQVSNFHTVLSPFTVPPFNFNGPGAPSVAALFASLPVELSEFTATEKSNSVLLNWTTETESGSDYFEVQRSTDGQTFSAIGQVAAAGDSQEAIDYEFVDHAPVTGVNYYRLRQVDLTGAQAVSEVVVVNQAATGIAVGTAFPNPATNQVSVSVTGEWSTDQVDVSLLDAAGKLVSNWVQSPGTILSRDIREFPAGIYHLRFQNGEQLVTTRVVFRGN